MHTVIILLEYFLAVWGQIYSCVSNQASYCLIFADIFSIALSQYANVENKTPRQVYIRKVKVPSENIQ